MRRTLFLGIGICFLGAAWPPVALDRVELAPRTGTQTLGVIPLPCEITIQGANQSAKAIEVDLNESRVKTKSGLWQTLEVAGGEGVCTRSAMALSARSSAKRATCTLERACNQERRYKFKMTYDGNIVWAYYPSANGWTTDTTLDLGDIGRHFRGY